MKAEEQRVTALDSKATLTLTYSIAILAFLVTRTGSLIGAPALRSFLILLAAGFAAVGCVYAGLAIRSARNWQTMSEATWFPSDRDVWADADTLGRWYLRAMHQAAQVNYRITNQKAAEVVAAQLAIAAAGICLALSVIVDAVSALRAASLS